MSEEKNKVGRPSKLTDDLLKVTKEIIEDDINAIILTDLDLIFLINERLEEKARICDATFENWKAGKFSDEDKGKDFLGLIKKALIKQRRELFKKFRDDEKSWQKYAWIIERKFDEWNIKHKSDLTTDGKPLPIIPLNNVQPNNSNNEDTETKQED